MAQVNTIKDLYENEELSLREIARRTKLSFQTVQKYAYMEDWSEEKLPDLQAEHYPTLENFIPAIDEWMEGDRKVPRKQRHTAMRIYHRLQEELGYGGSYSSVKRYVRKKKLMMKLVTEGCLPLAFSAKKDTPSYPLRRNGFSFLAHSFFRNQTRPISCLYYNTRAVHCKTVKNILKIRKRISENRTRGPGIDGKSIHGPLVPFTASIG